MRPCGRPRSSTTSGRFCADRHHRFWPDAVSLTDASVFNQSLVRGPKQLTDVYLLGLARAMDGCLVTLDATVPLKAVIKARPDQLCVLTA